MTVTIAALQMCSGTDPVRNVEAMRRLVREAHPIDPLRRYRWYRDHDMAHRLETRLTQLRPELVQLIQSLVEQWGLPRLRQPRLLLRLVGPHLGQGVRPKALTFR